MQLGEAANTQAAKYGMPLAGVRILAAEQMQARRSRMEDMGQAPGGMADSRSTRLDTKTFITASSVRRGPGSSRIRVRETGETHAHPALQEGSQGGALD